MPKTASDILWLLLIVGLIALVWEIVRNPTSAITTYLRMQFMKLIGWVEREEKIIVADVETDASKLAAAISALVHKHVAAAPPIPVPVIPAPAPVPTPAQPPAINVQALIDAAEKAIQDWLAPAIDYTKVTAAELTALFKEDLACSATTYLDYVTGAVTYPSGGAPDPNSRLQGKFLSSLEGGPVPTEAERAYVGYRDESAGGISAHFFIGADGTVTAR